MSAEFERKQNEPKKNSKLSYNDALILAPMVRVSTFPLRLLCLKYGANIVFGPEIIDYKLMNCHRKTNAELGTFDLVDKQKQTRLIFRTLRTKKEPVVCQIGSCDSIKFLKSSLKVARCVRGIDLNMGCPKPFSINKGIGASLLDPKKMCIVEDMLKTFKRNKVSNNISLSVKIRLLKSNKKTINLCKMIEKCGVDCITVHARYIEDRSEKAAARVSLLKDIVDNIKLPIIYNGDIFKYEDIDEFMKLSNCDGVMIARGAMYNPSIFSCDGVKNINDIIEEYIDINEKYKYPIHQSKFVMEKMILAQSCFKKKSKIFQEFHQTSTYDECRLINAKLKAYASANMSFSS